MFQTSLSLIRTVPRKVELCVASAATIAMVAFSAYAADAAAPDGAAAPQPPAPVGVFGADMPAAGHAVISFLPSYTRNEGNDIGTDSVTPQYIATTIPWIYHSGEDLRLVPEYLETESEGLGIAYGLTRNITVVAAGSYVEKKVEMETFKGTSGTTELGWSTGSTEGFGDTPVATIVRVYEDPINQVHLNAGFSLPTGRIAESISLLKPTDTQPSARAFYGLQIGTGTVDVMPGITYSGALNAWSWGLSYRGRFPLDDNAQGWKYGNLDNVTGWGGYSWLQGLETTLRLDGVMQGRIHGSDPLINGAAEAANPAYYGGERLDLFGGVIVSGKYIGLDPTQLAVEGGVPLYQNINGPQLARDYQIIMALRLKL